MSAKEHNASIDKAIEKPGRECQRHWLKQDGEWAWIKIQQDMQKS